MKVQANPEPLKLQSQPPLINTPAQSSLSPFDKNYTLTGLIKHIESSLTELIQTKRATMSFQIARQHSEVQKLMKIKEEVGVLKTLIIYNINEIFSNIYPSDKDDKKLDKTNHTHSPDTFKNDQLHHKEMTITQFEVQKLNDQLEEIISFQVNNEKIVHQNIIQSEEANQDDEPLLLCNDEDEDERTKVEKERLLREITPFYLRQMENRYEIKIEEDQDDQLDLFCYQDEKVINGRKQRKQIVETRQDKGFSPILQRPVEEQQTMQKQVKNEVNVTLSQKQKPIFGLTAITQAEVKRRLFTYINRPVLTQRYSTKRYIYLEKGRQK